MNESLNFLHKYCDFSEPNWVWLLTGISRNKDNKPGYDDFFRRQIIHNESEIDSCYHSLKRAMTNSDTIYRIYISLNSRDTIKTFFNYKIKLELLTKEMMFSHNYDGLNRMDSIWKTELSANSSRGTKRFLLDIDDFKDSEKALSIVKSFMPEEKIYACRVTKNGLAIVVDGCDVRPIVAEFKKENIAIDTHNDSMVYVETIHG